MRVLSGVRRKIRKKFMSDKKVYDSGVDYDFDEFFRLDVSSDLNKEDLLEKNKLIDKIGRDKIEKFCTKNYLIWMI